MGNNTSGLEGTATTHKPYRQGTGLSHDSGYSDSTCPSSSISSTYSYEPPEGHANGRPAQSSPETTVPKKTNSPTTKPIKAKCRTEKNSNAILKMLENMHNTLPADELAGKYVEKENISAAFLTRQGGTINIDGRVSLYVPPDALPDNGVHLIYIQLLPSGAEEKCVLRKGETWLTPIIECGPNGQTFLKNVFLSIHTTRQVPPSKQSSLKPTIYCGTHTDDREEWNTVDHGEPLVQNGRVIFEVDHFTRFGVSGNLEALEEDGELVISKWIKAVAFVEGEPSHPVVRVRLCDVQYFKNLQKEEEVFISRMRQQSSALQIDDSGHDLVVRLMNVSNATSADITEKIEWHKVWHTNKAEVRLQMGRRVTGETIVEIFQENVAPTSHNILMLPLTNAQKYRSVDGVEAEQSEDKEVLFLKQQPDLNPSPHSSHFMSDQTFRELCVILEGMNDIAMINKGWQALAVQCGIVRNTVVTCIERRARYQMRSPAAIVLDYYFTKYQWQDALDALQRLSNVCLEMDNHDAKRVVDESIQTKILAEAAPVPRRHIGRSNPYIASVGDEVFTATEIYEETTDQGCTCFGYSLLFRCLKKKKTHHIPAKSHSVRTHQPVGKRDSGVSSMYSQYSQSVRGSVNSTDFPATYGMYGVREVNKRC